MLRYRVAAMVVLFLLLGAAREDELQLGWRFVFAALALASSYVSATALNDLADEEVDKVNHPRNAGRPLVEGTAGRADLILLCFVAAALAVGAAVPLGSTAVAVIVAGLAISQAYSARPLRISYRVGGAPPALAAAYVAVPYSLGIVAARGDLHHAASLLTLALVLLFGARIVLKDFRDRVGDAQFGKGTILLRFGKTTTCVASLAGLLAANGVFGLTLDRVLWALVQVFVLAIGWMLWQLWRADDPVAEQVAIGTGARVGNGLLLSMLAWLVTGGDAAATALVATTVIVSFLPLAARPGDVVVGYKG